VGEGQRFLAAHRARDVFIGGQEADVFDVQLEKSPGDGAELERGGIGGVAAAGLVDNEFEIVESGLLPDDFDDGGGVGDRGGLRRGDDEDFAGGDGELNDPGADAGGGFDKHEIGGGAGDDLEPVRAGDDDFLEAFLALDDVV
jgi:hypothetical protein